MFFDLFKAIDYIKSCHKTDFSPPKCPIFLHACATCSELPTNTNTMVTWFLYLMFALFTLRTYDVNKVFFRKKKSALMTLSV